MTNVITSGRVTIHSTREQSTLEFFCLATFPVASVKGQLIIGLYFFKVLHYN